MSEEKKSGGFFHFVWKCMITLVMFYGVAYVLGYDKVFLGFLENTIVPGFQNTIEPALKIAKSAGAAAIDAAHKTKAEVSSNVSKGDVNE